MASHVIRPAARTEGITYAIRDIVVEARKAQAAGKELLYLNIGDPNQFDFDTPRYILDAVKDALYGRKNGYAPSDGYPESLEAIREWADGKGIRDIQDIVIGHGASEPIELALTALADPGDNVLTPAPGYPLYTAVMAKLGAEENPYLLDEENEWQPDPADIEARINERTRALVLINPNNPTGSVCSREVMEQVMEIAARHRLVVLSDEIYDRLVFDGAETVSPASLRPDVPVITFGGLAKVFVGPGLRIGWGVTSGPADVLADYVEAMRKLARARICANGPIQCAVPRALAGPLDYLGDFMATLKRRRDLTMAALTKIPGISCVNPKGAFYCFPRIDIEGFDDKAWVTDLVRETGVVVVHGSGFRQKPGTAHFRIVYLPPEDVLERAYRAIADHLASYTG